MRRTLMVALLVVGVACGGGGGPTPVESIPPPQPTPPPTPTSTPTPGGGTATFTTIYDRIIATNCIGCHGDVGSPDAGTLFMSTRQQAYSQLVNVPANGNACAGQGIRVIPGNPGASLLVDKISRARPACGLTMPPFSGPLGASDVQTIRDWILAGARDD